MHKIVIERHAASYPDPIVVKEGDVLSLTGESERWDGHLWLWAIGPDGKAGWIPDTLAKRGRTETLVARDYSAVELSCEAGEILEAAEETHGWTWCRSSQGNEGWVPSGILRSVAQGDLW